MASTGQVEILSTSHTQPEQLVNDWKNKHLIFVEDIIDTGLTMQKLTAFVDENIHPASMR
jgi:hypoxanthine-guanine phosphoribosyltransferase